MAKIGDADCFPIGPLPGPRLPTIAEDPTKVFSDPTLTDHNLAL
jgi:hypothetical protein